MQDTQYLLTNMNAEFIFKGKLVLLGGRDENTELWKLPINPIYKQNHQNQHKQLGAIP